MQSFSEFRFPLSSGGAEGAVLQIKTGAVLGEGAVGDLATGERAKSIGEALASHVENAARDADRAGAQSAILRKSQRSLGDRCVAGLGVVPSKCCNSRAQFLQRAVGGDHSDAAGGGAVENEALCCRDRSDRNRLVGRDGGGASGEDERRGDGEIAGFHRNGLGCGAIDGQVAARDADRSGRVDRERGDGLVAAQICGRGIGGNVRKVDVGVRLEVCRRISRGRIFGLVVAVGPSRAV